MAARGFIGAGDLYIARQVNGVFAAYEGPYECTKFEIKPNVELKEMTSKGRSTYGQVIESVAIPQPADLTIDMPEVNKESLSIALLGTVAGVSQVGGSLVDQNVTITAKGVWYALPKSHFTSITAKDAGNTTLIEGVDFITDKVLGWIKVLPDSTLVTAGEVIKVSGVYSTTTGDEIKGSTNAQLRARFKLVGKNFADDLPFVVTVHEAIIAADSAFDFLQDDFASISLPGRMKTPTGFTEPFTVVQTATIS
jgi:hypothetical protein